MSNVPTSWKKSSLPHKFCPGCGQALALKILGSVIDEMNLADKLVYGTDIGCSLLSWNLFNVDTIQTHHGRATPTMVGLKRAKPEAVALAFMGDGGGYAIGAQHLVNACMRNDKITIILINNANYAMTGGQMAPTTLIDEKTTTTPEGRSEEIFGRPMHGPEMLSQIAEDDAYIARTISTDVNQTKQFMTKAIQNQIDGRGFSFLEILSMCPVNWKTDAKQSLAFLEDLKKIYPLGEIKKPEVKNG